MFNPFRRKRRNAQPETTLYRITIGHPFDVSEAPLSETENQVRLWTTAWIEAIYNEGLRPHWPEAIAMSNLIAVRFAVPLENDSAAMGVLDRLTELGCEHIRVSIAPTAIHGPLQDQPDSPAA